MGMVIRQQNLEPWHCPPAALEALRRAAKNDYKCGLAACVGGHVAMIFRKPLGIPWEVFVGDTLGLCESHVDALTQADAPHQTPKAAARFLQRLMDERPECCR